MKKTKIGLIPEDWEFSNIGNYCDVITGGTPSTKIEEYFNPPEIPWMRSGEIKGYKIKSISTFISKKGLENSAARILPRKSVVIALAGQGKTRGTTSPLEIKSSCNQSVACMVPNGKLNYIFLHYHLSRLYKYIRNITGDVGREGLNLKLIRKFPLILPPLNEQQKIATILSNVDDLILQTDKIIENLQILKRGLMQRLFTEGLGHTEFKQTRLGKIPKEWEIKKLENILILEYGKGLPKRKRQNGPIPVVGSNGIIDYHNEHLVNGPGIVIGRKGSMGKVSWINENFWPIDTTYFIKIIDNSIDKKWLYYALTNLNLERLSLSDVVPGLNREYAYSRNILIPKLYEQEQIVKILENIDKIIENEQNYLNNLKNTKKGLMQELLTGKKRVKINQDEVLL